MCVVNCVWVCCVQVVTVCVKVCMAVACHCPFQETGRVLLSAHM